MNKPQAVKNNELASEISKKITNFTNWREPNKQKWDRFYKLYRSYLEPKNYPWQSNIFVPYAFSTVETIVPRLISTKPQVDVLPRTEEDDIYAEVQAKLIDFQWDQMGMDDILPDVIRQMLTYGTSILKISWKKEIEIVKEEVPTDAEMPELGSTEVEMEKVITDRPDIEMIDLYDFFWDPTGYSIETCSWVAHRTYRSYRYLLEKQRQGIYKNIKLLKDNAKNIYIDNHDLSERQDASNVSDPRGYLSGHDSEGNIEVVEYWENDRVVTVANGEVIIREEKSNPFDHGRKPFVRLVDQSVPKEFLGIGEIEPIETLQYELNDMRNQRMDNATMILNKMWLVENGQNVDEDELVSDVGGVIHTDDINAVKSLVQQDIPNSSYREETLIKADIQQSTGITDYTKGVASDALANETATGISLMQEAGNSRLRLKMMNLESAIREVGELMVALNAQFIEEEQVIRITGELGTEWATIKPEHIKTNFDVMAQAGSRLEQNDAINKKQAMEMFQLFAGDPDINQLELKKRVLLAGNEKNIDKLIMDPEQAAAAQAGQPPEQGGQVPLSNVPGGAAGMPGNNDLNAQGIMQEALPEETI